MRELVHSPSDTQSPFLLDVVSNLNPEEILWAEPPKVPDVCVCVCVHARAYVEVRG